MPLSPIDVSFCEATFGPHDPSPAGWVRFVFLKGRCFVYFIWCWWRVVLSPTLISNLCVRLFARRSHSSTSVPRASHLLGHRPYMKMRLARAAAGGPLRTFPSQCGVGCGLGAGVRLCARAAPLWPSSSGCLGVLVGASLTGGGHRILGNLGSLVLSCLVLSCLVLSCLVLGSSWEGGCSHP